MCYQRYEPNRGQVLYFLVKLLNFSDGMKNMYFFTTKILLNLYILAIMKINQICFKTLKDFDSNSKYRKSTKNPGVYIWGFSLEKDEYTIPSNHNMFFPYYVGKVERENGCMFDRTQNHLAQLMGGNYPIFDILASSTMSSPIGVIHKSYQKVSKKAKTTAGIGPALPDPSFANLLHFPEGVHRMHHFTADTDIKSQLEWMLKHFCIMYLKLEKYNKKDIIELEKYIGNLINYDFLITKRLQANPNLKVTILNSSGNINVVKKEDLFLGCRGQMLSSKFGI
jgi:hypothetical protein